MFEKYFEFGRERFDCHFVAAECSLLDQIEDVPNDTQRAFLELLAQGKIEFSATMRAENEPAYSVIYELENPTVLTSPEWNEAVEAGRWPAQVRPYTRNRRHVLLKMMSHAD